MTSITFGWSSCSACVQAGRCLLIFYNNVFQTGLIQSRWVWRHQINIDTSLPRSLVASKYLHFSNDVSPSNTLEDKKLGATLYLGGKKVGQPFVLHCHVSWKNLLRAKLWMNSKSLQIFFFVSNEEGLGRIRRIPGFPEIPRKFRFLTNRFCRLNLIWMDSASNE